jgi:hypothetical protein
MAVSSSFRFKPTDTIGAAAAEDDQDFLTDCFVGTDALPLISDMQNSRLLVLGRTGAGKSALLTALELGQRERVIRISPEQLALTYVANSTVLNFFGTLGSTWTRSSNFYGGMY